MKRVLLPVVATLLATAAGCELGPTSTEFSGLPLEPGPYVLLDSYLFDAAESVVRVVTHFSAQRVLPTTSIPPTLASNPKVAALLFPR